MNKIWYVTGQSCGKSVVVLLEKGSNFLILYMIPTYRDILDITVSVLTWRDQLSDSSTITPRKRVSVMFFFLLAFRKYLMGKEGLLYS